MKIKKQRIRNPQKYLAEFKENETLRIGVKISDKNKERVQKIGFDSSFTAGEVIIPRYDISKYTYENAEGKCIIRKDLPKELAERYIEWTLTDWGGNIHSGWSYVPYKRYQREHLLPRALELIIAEDNRLNKWIVSQEFTQNKENYEDIKLMINMLLSIFGECEIVNEEFEEPLKSIRSVKWEILRPGVQTEEKIRRTIKEIVNKSKESMYVRNLNLLMEHCNENIAIGTQEFKGYIVFIHGKYAILESLMPNNATYILDKNWEEISKLTKTEVLDQELQIDRIFHNSNWEEKISKYILDN